MDPLEQREIDKLLALLDVPEVQDKIAAVFTVAAPTDGTFFGKLVPNKNVIESEKETANAAENSK